MPMWVTWNSRVKLSAFFNLLYIPLHLGVGWNVKFMILKYASLMDVSMCVMCRFIVVGDRRFTTRRSIVSIFSIILYIPLKILVDVNVKLRILNCRPAVYLSFYQSIYVSFCVLLVCHSCTITAIIPVTRYPACKPAYYYWALCATHKPLGVELWIQAKQHEPEFRHVGSVEYVAHESGHGSDWAPGHRSTPTVHQSLVCDPQAR